MIQPHRALAGLVIAASAVAFWVGNSSGQSAPPAFCEATLIESIGRDPLGYQPRGDRCEGRYAREQSSDLIAVVGASLERDNRSARGLSVAWEPTKRSTRLRALALRPRLYYRMDTLATGRSVFNWPAEILSTLELDARELAVLAWDPDDAIGGELVARPVTFGTQPERSPKAILDLQLLASVEFDEYFVSTAQRAGSALKPIQSDRPLEYGYYPADTMIHVRLPRPASGQLLRIDITARSANRKGFTGLWVRG